MKLKHLAATLAIALGVGTQTAVAQYINSQETYKRSAALLPAPMPTSHALAHIGQLRFELGYQCLLTSKVDTIALDQSFYGFYPTFYEARSCQHSDHRLGASYTPWENVTLGLGFGHSSRAWNIRYNFYNREEEKLKYAYSYASARLHAELSATYHAHFGERYAWEAGYTFAIGKQRHYAMQKIVTTILDWLIPVTKGTQGNMTEFSRLTFGHSLTGGLSAFTNSRALQATLMLTAGIAHYGKIKDGKTHTFDWARIRNRMESEKANLYLHPTLMFAWHAKRVFSLQAHVGLAMASTGGGLQVSHPTLGLQASWRILNTTKTPEN